MSETDNKARVTHTARAVRCLPIWRTASTKPHNRRVIQLNAVEWILNECGVWYWLGDNGGEFNITVINSGKLTRSVPFGPDPVTTSWRIRKALDGQEIDYTSTQDPSLEEEARLCNTVFQTVGYS